MVLVLVLVMVPVLVLPTDPIMLVTSLLVMVLVRTAQGIAHQQTVRFLLSGSNPLGSLVLDGFLLVYSCLMTGNQTSTYC